MYVCMYIIYIYIYIHMVIYMVSFHNSEDGRGTPDPNPKQSRLY